MNPFSEYQYPISHQIWKYFKYNQNLNWFSKNIKNINRFNKALIYVINDKSTNDIFPKFGRIKKSGSYFYIDINDNSAYITKISNLLNIVNSIFNYPDKKGCKPGVYNIVPPPSPSGSHVTLYTNSKQQLYQNLGKTVYFSIIDLVSYKHDKLGYEASGFDSSIYPCQWYVLKVKLDPTLKNIFDPHISVGILARKSIKYRCGNILCNNDIKYKCGNCERVFYCGKTCQKIHWNTHHHKICNIK